MNKLTYVGIAVALLGVAALAIGQFSYTESKPVLDAGPLHVTSHEEHRVSIPLVAGIVIVIAGLGLIVIGRRAA